MKTIIDFLITHAHEKAEEPAFTYLEDNGNPSQLCFAELHQSALSICHHLLDHVSPGESVVLLFDQGLEYIQSFLGCLYAGVVAVPLYPPKNNKNTTRVLAVIEDCNTKLALTSSALKPFLEKELESLAILDFEECINSIPNNHRNLPKSEQLAFLQYTSGSTGSPKGVMVCHGNILANLASLKKATGCSSHDVFCNWLPLFHDLGLVNTLLLPVYLGAHSIIMSPARFIKRPLAWIEAIHQNKASICGAPNFAFDYCLTRIQQDDLTDLDLSSWRIAFNAAEPIDTNTLQKFSNLCEKTGFQETAFYPSYGMAEATVFISGGLPTASIIAPSFSSEALQRGEAEVVSHSQKKQALVACGTAQSNHTIKIVSPQSMVELPKGQVGEIWFSGPSVAKGYWNAPEKTKEVFGARLKNDSRKYLRTGDLGFIHQNELFISGRLKDILIIKGRNYYPQDIEKMAYEACTGLSQGGGVAFELNGKAILIQEVSRRYQKKLDYQQACKSIQANVFEAFEILLEDIVFIKSGQLNKTSSGKVQRNLTKKRYLSQTFESLSSLKELNSQQPSQFVAPSNDLEKQLCELWQEVLGIQRIGINENFLSLGGHSLLAVQLVSKIRSKWNCDVSIRSLFEHQTIRSLAHVITTSQVNSIPLVKKAPLGNQLPLSHMQQSLWLLDHISPETSQYNLFKIFQIEGKLDVTAITLAFQTLIKRHHILRTTIHLTESGEPIQAIQTNHQLTVPLIDLTGLSNEAQKQATTHYIKEEASQTFNLSTDLMLRVKILRCADQSYLLLVTIHHIAFDGWSQGILTNELSILYQAYLNETPFPLPELEIQYADYANWQRHWLQGEILGNYLRFWEERLQGLPKVHNLPLDYPRPAVQRHEGATHYQILNAELLERLNTLAHTHDATLFMVLHTAFAILLSRHSNENDIAIGTVVANRNQAELAPLVGLFINTLVLRTDLSDDPNFVTLLQRSKEYLLNAYDYQQLPFEKLKDHLQPDRNLNHSPLFQVLLTLQNNVASKLELSGLTLNEIDYSPNVAKYDLALNVVEKKDGLYLNWEYATALFDSSTIQRMAKHFAILLRGILSDPQTKASEIPILTFEEEQQLLMWTEGKIPPDPYSKNSSVSSLSDKWDSAQCIHELFEEQVIQNPEAIALVFAENNDSITFPESYHFNKKLTYNELNKRANQVAHYLVNQGIKANTLVGLFVERSLEMVVGILGISKAGGAYVPLDPSYPSERLNYILSDSGIEVVLTQSHLANNLSVLEQNTIQHLVPLDSFEIFANSPDENLDKGYLGLTSSSLASVIYTSGSTGQPKGVVRKHRSIINRVLWMLSQFPYEEQETLCHITTLSFVRATPELFTPLCRGKKLVIVPLEAVREGPQLGKIIEAENISRIITCPSLMRTIMEWEDNELDRLSGLKYWFVGGEPLLSDLTVKVRSYFPQLRICILYGSTETEADATFYEVPHSEPKNHRVPIGRPLPHTSVYLLGKALQPVPIGVTGEICVAGKCLAQGYLNLPQLTKDVFITKTIGNKEKVLYRTGDYGRYLPDGNIEYLERIDSQVKIRGFRIELDEIESILLTHEQITASIVIAHTAEPSSETHQLVAYVVPRESMDIDQSEKTTDSQLIESLQNHLKAFLPDYMIPTLFIVLEQLPLTPHGKVDRKALPTPMDSLKSSCQYVAPNSYVEQQLCEIWQRLLNVERIGIAHNFFELGGHSLTAIKLLTEIEKQFCTLLTVKMIFENQTIYDQAKLIETVGNNSLFTKINQRFVEPEQLSVKFEI